MTRSDYPDGLMAEGHRAAAKHRHGPGQVPPDSAAGRRPRFRGQTGIRCSYRDVFVTRVDLHGRDQKPSDSFTRSALMRPGTTALFMTSRLLTPLRTP